jgi:DNA-binding GntR family transcriptional regulator
MGQSLREIICEKIREEITYGKLSPGERLLESKLVEQFKTSRSPIREALRQLESEGLISFERNKGITVPKLSVEEVNEIYDLRMLLESYAAYLSVEKTERDDVAYLKDLFRRMKTASKEYDLVSWIQNNTLFHNFFHENCGSKTLDQILVNLKRRVHRYQYTIIRIPDHFKEYLEQHEGVLRGYEEKNAKMVERYVKLHIKTIKEVLVSYLNTFSNY